MPTLSVITEKKSMMDGGVHVQMETFASVTDAPSDATLVRYDSEGNPSKWENENDGEGTDEVNKDFYKKSNVEYYGAA